MRNDPKFHLIIAGKNDGIDFSKLSECNNVTIIDRKISNIDFLSYIKLSDVILLPYRKISQSGVLFSAINNSIPVIVSNAGGLEDPLSIGRIGWTIGNSTYENLRNTMNSIAEKPDVIDTIKSDKTSFYNVKRYYSWNRISEMTKELYNSCSQI